MRKQAAILLTLLVSASAAPAETSCGQGEPWIRLFNGKDLTGWKRHENLPGHGVAGKWTVEQGAIVGVQDPPGQGGFLTTLAEYQDFELKLQTKIEWPFDSGVFLRTGPDGKSHQVGLDYRPGGEIGHIYLPWTQSRVHSCPEGIKHWKKDAWNDLRIRCMGEPAHIRVWLNGTKITDFQHTEATTRGVPEKGCISLQIHPGGEGFEKARALFRDIRIRKGRGPEESLPEKDAYLGQTPPGEKARLFAPEIMQHKVHSSPTFSPDGREIYWSTCCEPDEIRRIMVVRYENGNWGAPQVASFSGTYKEDQPFVTGDGSSLYFCSKRPIPGQDDPPLNMWVTPRMGQNWCEPRLVPSPISNESVQWTPSLTRDGTLCYDSDGIRLAKPTNNGFTESQLLPESINDPGSQNWTPLIAPDGRFILFASGRQPNAGSHDIWISSRNGHTWDEPINLGPKVNTERQERFPGLSPDGKYLFFTRSVSGPCYHDLYWIRADAVLPNPKGLELKN